MKCSKCGAELSNDTKFCSYCGAKIETEQPIEKGTKSPYVFNMPPIPDVETFKKKAESFGKQFDVGGKAKKARNTTPSKKNENSKSIAVIALSVVLLGIISMVLLFSGKDKSNGDVAGNNSNNNALVANSTFDEIALDVAGDATIEPGTEYAYMSDAWNVYIAKAVSEDIIKIESWHKSSQSDKKLDYRSDLGSFRIREEENGFRWVDDSHTAFTFVIQDKNNSDIMKPTAVVFTININDSDKYKGTDYDDEIACYSYVNDDWHTYRAIPLTDTLIKIECWYRTSSGFFDKHCFAWDVGVIDTKTTSTDFAWGDAEHNAFTISMKDPQNDSCWEEEKLTSFILENEDYKHSSVFSYLGLSSAKDGNQVEMNGFDASAITVTMSEDDFIGMNYTDAEEKLREMGFNVFEYETLETEDVNKPDDTIGAVEIKSWAFGKGDFSVGDTYKSDAIVVLWYYVCDEPEPNLTVDNCPELAAMLANKAEIDESYSDFVRKYAGRVIEFDGRIDYCTKHGDNNTRFDYLVSAGDYDPDHQIGPTFKFENVAYYDLNTNLDTVSVGLNVHIVAEVVSFDSNSGLFYLDPVEITGR